jgi:hypothetical protein
MPIGEIFRREQDAICLPNGQAGMCHESGVRATYYRFIMKNVDLIIIYFPSILP